MNSTPPEIVHLVKNVIHKSLEIVNPVGVYTATVKIDRNHTRNLTFNRQIIKGKELLDKLPKYVLYNSTVHVTNEVEVTLPIKLRVFKRTSFVSMSNQTQEVPAHLTPLDSTPDLTLPDKTLLDSMPDMKSHDLASPDPSPVCPMPDSKLPDLTPIYTDDSTSLDQTVLGHTPNLTSPGLTTLGAVSSMKSPTHYVNIDFGSHSLIHEMPKSEISLKELGQIINFDVYMCYSDGKLLGKETSLSLPCTICCLARGRGGGKRGGLSSGQSEKEIKKTKSSCVINRDCDNSGFVVYGGSDLFYIKQCFHIDNNTEPMSLCSKHKVDFQAFMSPRSCSLCYKKLSMNNKRKLPSTELAFDFVKSQKQTTAHLGANICSTCFIKHSIALGIEKKSKSKKSKSEIPLSEDNLLGKTRQSTLKQSEIDPSPIETLLHEEPPLKKNRQSTLNYAMHQAVSYVKREFENKNVVKLKHVHDIYKQNLSEIYESIENEHGDLKFSVSGNNVTHFKELLFKEFDSNIMEKKVWKDIILYAPSMTFDDVLTCLAKSLNRQDVNDDISLENLSSIDLSSFTVPNLDSFAKILNEEYINKQANEIIGKYKNNPLMLKDLDLTDLMTDIDPILWNFFVQISMSERESSKADDFTWHEHYTFPKLTKSYQKTKINKLLFLIYTTLYLRNPNCDYPFQIIIADLVRKFGGSLDLLETLSKFGITVSPPTYKNYLKKIIDLNKTESFTKGLINRAFSIFSIDNLDKMWNFARVKPFAERSWHGLTSMLTLPKPNSLKYTDPNMDTQNDSGISDVSVSENMDDILNIAFCDGPPKLKCIPIYGDGNCFYRSLVQYIEPFFTTECRNPTGQLSDIILRKSEDSKVSKLKKNIVTFISRNIEFLERLDNAFKQSLLENKPGEYYNSFTERLDAMASSNYAGQLDILASAFYLKRKIILLEKENQQYVKRDMYPTGLYEDKPPIFICYYPDTQAAAGHYDPLFPLDYTSEPINLCKPEDADCSDFIEFFNTVLQPAGHSANSDSSYPSNHPLATTTFDIYVPTTPGTSQSTVRMPTTPLDNSQMSTNIFEEHSYFGSQIESNVPEKLSNDFYQLSDAEKEALEKYQSYFRLFCSQRNINAECFEHTLLPDLKGKIQMESESKCEMSYLKYFSVLNSSADNIDTLRDVIESIRDAFVTPSKSKHLIIAGDQKIFSHIITLKTENPEYYDFVIPFIGDWHTLKNFQEVLMKIYFAAGLEAIAKPPNSKKNKEVKDVNSNFKLTNAFIFQSWEALARCQVKMFFNYRTNPTHCQLSNSEIQNEIESCLSELSKAPKEHFSDVQKFLEKQKELKNSLTGFDDEFNDFRKLMSEKDQTFKFWDGFIHEDGLMYTALFIAIRTGDWTLRMASLKKMAPIFYIFDRQNYARILPEHFSILSKLPSEILNFFRMGGFVTSLNGTYGESVAFDECHEMTINRHVKQAISKFDKKAISDLVAILPFRASVVENILRQLCCGDSDSNHPKSLSMSNISATLENIEFYMERCHDSGLFEIFSRKERKLFKLFTNIFATPEQEHDLLNFHSLASDRFSSYVRFAYLKDSSVKVTTKKNNLKTFVTPKITKTTVKQSEQEKERIMEYFSKLIRFSIQTNTPIADIGQLLPYPRALCDSVGMPVKSPKSHATKFYESRYSNIENIFFDILPDSHKTECVVIDAMNYIYSSPRACHKYISDYAYSFLRFKILPWFQRGAKEVHLIFDDPNRHGVSPKTLERQKRDNSDSSDDNTLYAKEDLTDNSTCPQNWSDFLSNRTNKRKLCKYLSEYLVNNIGTLLGPNQKFITAGAFQDSKRDCAFSSVQNGTVEEELSLKSNHEEADSRIWFHVAKSSFENILIYSEDTDTYHIGMPLLNHLGKSIVIQLSNKFSANKYLNLNNLVSAFKNDYLLADIPRSCLTDFIQFVYITSGTDYTSSFYGHGKVSFFKVCFQYSKFIFSHDSYGSIINFPAYPCKNRACHQSDLSCDACNSALDKSLSGFLRLIGSVYFSKVRSSFREKSPKEIFSKIPALSALETHVIFCNEIRNATWKTFKFEDKYLPSTFALKYHFLRCLWTKLLWQQALYQSVTFPTITSFGFEKNGEYTWDTQEHINEVKNKIDELSRGCGCKKTRCETKQCKCRKDGKNCGPGCNCVECKNLPKADRSHETVTEEDLLEELLQENLDEDYSEEPDNDDMDEIDFSPDLQLLQ